jgi:hypothetical protein
VRKAVLVIGLWLGASWAVTLACFTGSPTSPDGGDAAASDAGCTSVFGCEASGPVADPCGDASLAIRARATFLVTCSGGPERGCHSELAGNTTLQVDMDSSSSWPYGTYGLINIPSSEMPDVLRIEPFHPESSYLYWKVTGDPRRVAGTGIMPLTDSTNWDSGHVSQCVVDLIGPWIEAGAP